MAENTEDRDSRTEEPTERKLAKAREKGDVPSSKEPGNMMVALSLFVLAVLILPLTGPQLTATLTKILSLAGTVEVGGSAAGLRDVGALTSRLFWAAAVTLVPVFGTMMALAVFAVLIQGEVVVSAERIRPKLSKISPAEGLKRLFSKDTLVEFGKNLAKIGAVAMIGLFVTQGAVTRIWQGTGFSPEALPPLLLRETAKVFLWTSALLVPLAILDIIWKRFQWREKQRMTIKELRDEMKESEGDPMIRRRREELRRKRLRQQIATTVPEATVVLTNPTHFAVALRYEQGRDAAPVCVAKGADLMAAQIRKLAHEHGVPVLENKPLTRALYEVVEVDAQIPGDHWRAVAEIIRYVLELKKNARRAPPPGTTPRED
ncbi:flagellar type III secretion system protein FlhB [Roseivivax sp. GX 12232]|uniref:EscU/YscU/HrcU family type III secretion system export apparatus switch protein n=1 Tax=Roseivivax sp. GX 12232 TaxID=2900547 RepID=UPI001E5AD624|nr:flagellar type III secretion system protein FlhB [Roseivivax sp. GX 12232]MCE0503870.1 flagellar type III secretion system protein FlhB [Roseivivax sp. GX 12232]